MYRADDFMVTQAEVETGKYHDLAEAIRRGCQLRPRKLKKCFQSGADGADALGAAMVAVGILEKRCTRRQLVKTFPELGVPFLHPVSGRNTFLVSLIVSMNDYLDWSREEIADWLCRAGDCKHEVKGGQLPLRKSAVIHLETIKVRLASTTPKPHHAYARTPRPAKRQILEPSDFHNVAEAMRRGCSLRPKKVKGVWKRGTTGACAVGAIAEGAGFTDSGMPWEKLWKMFPELKGFMRHPLTGCSMEVWQVISSVSENTHYSREQIADWLCIESGCTHEVQTCGLNLPMAA